MCFFGCGLQPESFEVSWDSEVITLQRMFDPGCSPAMYRIQGKSFAFPDLTSEPCPNCRADFLKRHGFYGRHLIAPGFEGEIMIRRFCCRRCGRTVSLLPSFCHPLRSYGLLAVFGILSEFYVKESAACLAAGDFMASTGVACSRQLLLHYRRRIEGNLNGVIMAVTEIRGLRAPPVTERFDTRKRVRQLLSSILSPQDCSLKMFELTKTTYLTPQAI